MLKIPWDSKYQIGIPEIDRQHQGIMELFNEFSSLVCQKEAREEAKLKFEAFTKVIAAHCAFEEALMKSICYPKIASQQAKHHELSEGLKIYRERLEDTKYIGIVGLTHTIGVLFIAHILEDDKLFAAFKNEDLAFRNKQC